MSVLGTPATASMLTSTPPLTLSRKACAPREGGGVGWDRWGVKRGSRGYMSCGKVDSAECNGDRLDSSRKPPQTIPPIDQSADQPSEWHIMDGGPPSRPHRPPPHPHRTCGSPASSSVR